ncbi:MAG: GH3 family domain-containing protein, partial [Burkholderiaceae bacterium]
RHGRGAAGAERHRRRSACPRMIGAIAAQLLKAATAQRAARFHKALDDCKDAQQKTLACIVRTAATTEYGRHTGLRGHEDARDFRAVVPVVTYDALWPWIERASGAPNVIAPGIVHHFESTSGSGGSHKRIPYNDALLTSFRSLFAVWANDLLRESLHPRSGRIFVSVSPRLSAQSKARHDADYLNGLTRLLVAPFLVEPNRCSINGHMVMFRDAVALALLNRADLEVISVWSPTYLLVLLSHVEARRGELAKCLPHARAQLLDVDAIDWMRVWPALQLISCWTDGAASGPAKQLARHFPTARIQGKGLIATEAPLTVPLVRAGGCVPLIDEVFIELEAADGSMHLLHEAQTGVEYAVVITQPGGLLRYRLGDRVRAMDRWRDTPLLEFIGRVDAVCDLVGEKLHEMFVRQVLRELVPSSAFALLVPRTGAVHAEYQLITDAENALPEHLDQALCANHRYREARALGQLAPPKIIVLREARRVVHDFLIEEKMAAGDIKDAALLHSIDRASRLLSAIEVRSTARGAQASSTAVARTA